MNVLSLLCQRWSKQRDVPELLRLMSPDGPFAGVASPETAAIYRLPLPALLEFDIHLFGRETPLSFRRGFSELFGLGDRIYVVDSTPLALFGKSTALVVFRGLNRSPRLIARTEGPIYIQGRAFPFFNAPVLRALAVHNANRIVAQRRPFGPVIEASMPPLIGPFPPSDLPNPTTGTAPPTNSPGSTTSSAATFLFYGICFQRPKASEQAIYFGPLEIFPSYVDNDPLWDETQRVTQAFQNRGYTTATGLAGDHDPAATGTAQTFDQMMAGLETHLNAQQGYCNSADDQLVIFVAAHGYQAAANTTGDVALNYSPSDDHDDHGGFVTYTELFDALKAMPKIAANPQKVVLIIESCRAGRLFEGGVIPPELAGMNILSGSASTGEMVAAGTFSNWIVDALGRHGAVSWSDFVGWVKHQSGNPPLPAPFGFPRNGHIGGCRATVTWRNVVYTGSDIGDSWSFEMRLDGISPATINGVAVQNVSRGTPSAVRKTTLANAGTLAPGVIVYDRFWPPCSPTNNVVLNVFAKGTEHDVFNDIGEATQQITFVCNGGASTAQVTVSVAEGNDVATMNFNLDIQTTCVP